MCEMDATASRNLRMRDLRSPTPGRFFEPGLFSKRPNRIFVRASGNTGLKAVNRVEH